ncbi:MULTISPECIES: hypothetical protein [Pseudoalteromonas]|uniref:Uncharacterized protein n=1 Tax=Pseudoalteromonas amylolytica TaxID=1859457 RepID=A0A1S1MVG1_9GAMM|nr:MULTISPECIES: hypothetical protein [Pseudoalteromonas]OHU87655.1 hypothetical protein BFC16_09420 [Pseudoalteromonas sp. JW3]OHU91097.1 hypothetical protein BET10_09535 [Pseudoalteromonas amylolytica]
MDELYTLVAWGLRALECAVLILVILNLKWRNIPVFGVYRFESLADEELYSCFLTCLCLFAINLLITNIIPYIFSLEVGVFELRRFYYSFLVSISATFCLLMFFFHSIKNCRFSFVARTCLFMSFVGTLTNLLQLVLRGYFDINILYSFYGPFIASQSIMDIAITMFFVFKFTSQTHRMRVPA